MMMTQRITKANEARYFAVNWEVWVKKPGPMAEVAIRKAAPSFTERLWLFWLLFILLPLFDVEDLLDKVAERFDLHTFFGEGLADFADKFDRRRVVAVDTV